MISFEYDCKESGLNEDDIFDLADLVDDTYLPLTEERIERLSYAYDHMINCKDCSHRYLSEIELRQEIAALNTETHKIGWLASEMKGIGYLVSIKNYGRWIC